MSGRNARRPARLHTVLLLFFLGCMGVLLLFVVLTLVPRMSDLLTRNAVDRTRETVLQSASSVDVYVNGLISRLNYAASTVPYDLDAGDGTWRERLDYLRAGDGDVTALAFFAEDGALLYATAGECRRTADETAGEAWFIKALERQGTMTYFSAPHVQSLFSATRPYVVTLSRAVDYYAGGLRRTGVMLMDVRATALSDLTDAVRLSESGYVYLLDENDQILFHPDLQLIYAGLAREDTAALVLQGVGVTEDWASGRDRMLISVTLAHTRWRMVGVAYVNEITQLNAAFVRITTIVLGCAALLSLAAAGAMAYFVTKPILHLEHKMQKVESGDLNVTITERGFSEIRAVSRAFNHMLQRIRALMDQVVQEQEKKRLYELNALQAQINPHFLYNALDSIIWMEERGRSREAITMVSALARLFRISISRGRGIILVSEELEHVRNYLIIQKMRFKDKFSYEIEAEEAALSERTIKLIVQPLVENTLNHAIDESTGAELHIRIAARVTADALYFTVEDDGVGIPADKLDQLLTLPSGKSGIGLRNVHERIQLTCGRQYGLILESEEDEGTRVTIHLPRPLEVTET